MLKSKKHFFSSKAQLQSGPFSLVKIRLPWVVIDRTFVQQLSLLFLLLHIVSPVDQPGGGSAAEQNIVRKQVEEVAV